jgi:hypothetical protein
MEWLIIGLVVAFVLVAIFALSLGAAADSVPSSEAETRALTDLTQVRSPTGKRFFPTDESIWDLAESLETLPEPDTPSTGEASSS